MADLLLQGVGLGESFLEAAFSRLTRHSTGFFRSMYVKGKFFHHHRFQSTMLPSQGDLHDALQEVVEGPRKGVV